VARNTILIVDDDSAMLMLMSDVLGGENSHLLSARSAEDALARIEASSIDLVISDQNMPGMSGLEFLGKVREEHPEILTMLMTASSELAIALRAIEEVGVYHMVLKPFNVADLRLTVQRALEYKRLLDERNHLLDVVATLEPHMSGEVKRGLRELLDRVHPDSRVRPS
jgi:DNA-binding NtrC family response regulator